MYVFTLAQPSVPPNTTSQPKLNFMAGKSVSFAPEVGTVHGVKEVIKDVISGVRNNFTELKNALVSNQRQLGDSFRDFKTDVKDYLYNQSKDIDQSFDRLHQVTMLPELLEMERSFNTLVAGTRDKQGYAITRSRMDNLREQQQHITVLKQVAMQLQNQPRPVSVFPAANVPLPPFPQRHPSDMGCRNHVQAQNANALHKNSSDLETHRLQDI